MKGKQIDAGEKVNSDCFDWLAFVPPSDSNFKSNLERANAATVNAVLLHIAPENNKARIAALKAHLRKLEKAAAPPDANIIAISRLADAQIVAVETSRVKPSPFETQERRRARFQDSEIQMLADSIQTHGMFQPILVRPSFPDFEIVFGERRFLAVRRAGLSTINCFIRDLTDAQVLELQYEENHRRQENSPLDDAFLFRFLMERMGYSEDQLADRLVTTRKNVVEKLKLNDLIEPAAADLESGALPLKHAYYLAKFPAVAQSEIVSSRLAYKYHDRDEKTVSFDEFKAEVEEIVVRRLADAPFDTLDPRLHIKNLLCPDCPERTGFEKHLFPDLAQDDSCLNQTCFRLKAATHLKLKREEIAAELPNPASSSIEQRARTIPLVTEKSYAPERTPFAEKVITNVQPLAAPECEFSEPSLAVGGTRKGERVYICRNNECAVHYPKPPEQSFDKKRFDLNLRLKIFGEALNWFDDYKSFWQFDDLVRTMIVKSLMRTVNDPSSHQIRRLVENWKNAPPHFINKILVEKFVAGLDKKQQSQILFVLTYADELYDIGSNFGDAVIRAIAENYTRFDYDDIAAEIRKEMEK